MYQTKIKTPQYVKNLKGLVSLKGKSLINEVLQTKAYKLSVSSRMGSPSLEPVDCTRLHEMGALFLADRWQQRQWTPCTSCQA
jgi:hypothetical protein